MSGLEELRRLEAEATPGPWEFDGVNVCQDGGEYADITPTEVECMSYCYGGSVKRMNKADAEFIVAARNELPRILDALDAVLALAETAPRFTVHGGGSSSGIVMADAVIAAITKALEGAGHE